VAKQPVDVGLGVPDGVVTNPIPGLGGKYVAGSDGHIYCYSEARVNARKPQPFRLLETIGSAGYPIVAIIEAGRRRSVAVHSLVARAFHGEPEPMQVARHLDGDPSNNQPTNLRWGSYAENEADKRRHGRTAMGERHGQAKLTDEAVRILRIAIPAGLWDTENAAKVFGVDPSTIRRIAAGRDWKHVE
jgi:hypothetical protein